VERREHGVDWVPARPRAAGKSGKTSAREALTIARQEIEQGRADFYTQDERPVEPSDADACALPPPRENRLFSLDRVVEIDDIIIKE
jgi:hypothetical protein